FFMYGEDIDLSFRMIKSGYKNFYAGKIAIIHFKGESTLKDQKYFKRFSEAMQLFYRKHFGEIFFLNLLYKVGSVALSAIKLINIPVSVKNSSDEKPICLTSQSTDKASLIRAFFPTRTVETKSTAVFLETVDSFKKMDANVLFVFDTETVAYKTLIKSMSALKDSHCEFAFLSKSSTFILKSEVSNRLGEVQIIL
ncbi:MAG: hypothetical protein Q8J97_13920, partial [Flavobacteriaceae bacterium]|nr:hypothetical protein [Flavobacteriaceae bacterium]